MTEPLAYSLISVSKKYLSLFNRELTTLSLDRYQYVLVLIDDHAEQLSQKALATLLQIDKSYMVTILDHLAKKGFIIREKNPSDRREQIVRLTDQARKDIPLIRTAIELTNNKALQDIPEKNLAIFNRVLQTIQHNLSDSKPSDYILEFKKLKSPQI